MIHTGAGQCHVASLILSRQHGAASDRETIPPCFLQLMCTTTALASRQRVSARMRWSLLAPCCRTRPACCRAAFCENMLLRPLHSARCCGTDSGPTSDTRCPASTNFRQTFACLWSHTALDDIRTASTESGPASARFCPAWAACRRLRPSLGCTLLAESGHHRSDLATSTIRRNKFGNFDRICPSPAKILPRF